MGYTWIDATPPPLARDDDATPPPLARDGTAVVAARRTSHEPLDCEMELHPVDSRHACPAAIKTYAARESWLGFDQEDALVQRDRPLPWPVAGFSTRQSP